METILKNGLKIITNIDKNSNVCTLSYSIKSGSFDELEHEHGIAHLVEHMLFKGTLNRDYMEINNDIEKIGGYLNAFTSYQTTNYYCVVPCKSWKDGIDVLSDMIFNHTIPENELIKEKKVVQEEIKMYSDDLSSYVTEKLIENMFNKYDNRKSIAGTIESVGNINRENIIDFINRNYFPSNITFIATGNINHQEIVDFISNYINKLDIDFVEYEKSYDKISSHALECKKIVYKKSEIEQTHLAFGLFLCGANHEDMVALKILNNILGGSSSSVLFNKIREEMGLAYTIFTTIEEISDVSILYGYAGLNKTNDVNYIVELITNEILNIKNNINESILEQTKQYLIGMLYIDLEKSLGKNLFISNKELFNMDYDFNILINKINSITIEDLFNVINKYLIKDNIIFTILKSKQ